MDTFNFTWRSSDRMEIDKNEQKALFDIERERAGDTDIAENAENDDIEGEKYDFNVPAAFSPHIDLLTTWFCGAVEEAQVGREIEGKIGNYSPDGFQSVVPESLFTAQLTRCKRSAAAGGIFDRTEKETTVTYMFVNGVRGTQYNDQRYEFVRKRRVSNIDVRISGAKTHLEGDSKEQPVIRLSYNVETPCAAPCAKIHLVRARQRESFYYKDTWRFDFTYVRQAASRQEVANAPLQHEIELEYIGKHEKVTKNDLTIQNNACVADHDANMRAARYNVVSMLLKLYDLTMLDSGMNRNAPASLQILQHIVKDE